MNIYFGMNFFFAPTEHKRMIESIKNILEKTHTIGTDVLVPTNGNIHDTAWCIQSDYRLFLKHADVLIVDTTYTPSVHPHFRQTLIEHSIALIECRHKSATMVRKGECIVYETSLLDIVDTILHKIHTL